MPDTIVSGNKQNVATGKDVRTRSKFKLDYHMFDTFRFGELHPHFVMECVPGDKNVSVRSEHNLRTYSLQAPLMQKISMKKDYFAVPMESILPFNWDKIYTNPVQGDDVPSDAGTYVSDFTSLVIAFCGNASFVPTLSAATGQTASQVGIAYTKIFRWLLTCELFYSNGNLLSSLGIHLAHLVKFGGVFYNGSYSNMSFDELFDMTCSRFLAIIQSSSKFITVTIGGDDFQFSVDAIGLRSALDLMRDNLGDFFLVVEPTTAPGSYSVNDYQPTIGPIGSGYPFGLDIKRVFAYQIVCAHYYSDDHVDYVYSAELYREYIGSIFSLEYSVVSSWAGPTSKFTYNGLECLYDYLSAFHLADVLVNTDFSDPADVGFALSYLQAIFGYKHSLRYKDYFVGSRTQPLAVGDVNVAVSSNLVSVVDVTQKTQLQRFLNSVNRSGRKFSNYIGELFGVHVAPDYHNPFFLGHTSDDIYGQEVENTGAAQQSNPNSVTAILRSNASRYAFEFDADRPCIILGLTYFDVPRSYWETIERQNFHKDRFDMFNPYMQFIGDQKVYEREITPSRHDYQVETFGYQLRHSEYKQRYNQASGGFVQNLPGYAFLNDYGWKAKQTQVPLHIGPSFIRSKNTELDRFYLSLTGFSLGSYFHFIVDNYNDVSASRPMVYAPSIL